MNAHVSHRRAGHLFTFLSLWVAAMLLGALLAPDIRHVRYRAGPRTASETILHRIFGSTRAAISHVMVLEADRYFHRGVPHQRQETAPTFFSVWANDISPQSPDELGKGEIEEIMPWLRFATLSDPTNVEAYLTTAFWLSREGEHARVLHVLDEAERHNPDDYRILMARGFHLFEGFMIEGALSSYAKALHQWPFPLTPTQTQARLDRAEILSFRGALLEIVGDFKGAIAAYEEVQQLFPDRIFIQRRMEALRSGDRDQAVAFWRQFIAGSAAHGEDCAEDGSSHFLHDHLHAHEEAHPPGWCSSCRTVH